MATRRWQRHGPTTENIAN